MMHKKDMIFLSILIACSESVVLFYFCSAKSPRSFLCMMISYAILLIFPLNIFLASLREHRTGTSLSTLETTEESSKQQREIEQFTHKQLKLHKNNFTQKLKELYILLEQNDLTTAQKILGEQIPLKEPISFAVPTLSLMVFYKAKNQNVSNIIFLLNIRFCFLKRMIFLFLF